MQDQTRWILQAMAWELRVEELQVTMWESRVEELQAMAWELWVVEMKQDQQVWKRLAAETKQGQTELKYTCGIDNYNDKTRN